MGALLRYNYGTHRAGRERGFFFPGLAPFRERFSYEEQPVRFKVANGARRQRQHAPRVEAPHGKRAKINVQRTCCLRFFRKTPGALELASRKAEAMAAGIESGFSGGSACGAEEFGFPPISRARSYCGPASLRPWRQARNFW